MRFTTDFPGGNGVPVRTEKTAYGWDVDFRAETKGREPMPLWFDFRLYGLTGERVRLRLCNAGQCLGDADGWTRNRPVYRTAEDGPWLRAASCENRMGPRDIRSTVFEVPLHGADFLEFAFCYPYTRDTLEQTLRDCGGTFAADVIGYSAQGRPLLRLSDTGVPPERERRCIFVIARQHAGETTGSWMADGMLRYLASEEGTALRRRIDWRFVPIVDTDGTEQGFYGKDQFYGDLNRAWAPWFAKRTELTALQPDILRCIRERKMLLLLDLHAPGHDERDTYFVIPGDVEPGFRGSLRRLWQADVCETEARGFQPPYFNEKPVGTNTSSQAGWSADKFVRSNGIPACSFECTYQGERSGRDYTVKDYQTLGACLARAAGEWAEKEE